MGVGGLLKQKNSSIPWKKTYHFLNPQANPHFLDLIMVAREIFILVSSETGSWKLESDLKREGKIGVCGRHYCLAISEQR